MPQNSLSRKEKILMRSAQSRLGVITSLGSARRGVVRCAESLPLSAPAFKVGAATLSGLAGAVLLRGILSSRRRPARSTPAAQPALSAPQRNMGRYLFSETVLTLLLPLCRRYFLGENLPVGSSPGNIIDRLFKTGR